MGNPKVQKEILDAVNIIVSKRMNNIAKILFGTVVGLDEQNFCTININGVTHKIRYYGNVIPDNNKKYPLFVPSSGMSQAFIITGVSSGGDGPSGDVVVYTPSVSSDGVLSWTNNGGLPNPSPVNIKGPQGKTGNTGAQGPAGADGKDGVDGSDGYSPTANVTQNDNGATITITDKNGTTTAIVTNGKDGQNGITPSIGNNGNWYLGTTDTGKPSRGEKGDTGATGATGPAGPAGPKGDTGDTGPAGQSAYAAAQAGGYTDTQANFYADLAAMQGLAAELAAI